MTENGHTLIFRSDDGSVSGYIRVDAPDGGLEVPRTEAYFSVLSTNKNYDQLAEKFRGFLEGLEDADDEGEVR